MSETVPSAARARWRWAAFVGIACGLIVLAFWQECGQQRALDADVRQALTAPRRP